MPKFTRVESQPGGERLHWMKWKVSDYVAQTRRFSLAERGALLELMAHSWLTGPLPSDAKRLASMLGISLEEFGGIWQAIRHFWIETSEGLVHPELEAERESAVRVYRSRAASGRKSAKTRRAKPARRGRPACDDPHGGDQVGGNRRLRRPEGIGEADGDFDLGVKHDVDRDGVPGGNRDDQYHDDADGDRDGHRHDHDDVAEWESNR